MSDKPRQPAPIEPATERVQEKDSPDTDEHNERIRTHGRTFTQREVEEPSMDVPPGVRTVRAFRNRKRRVIE
jgi:hypothetical protein